MKKTYIAPEVSVTELALESMIAQSGPGTSSSAADSQYGMDVKEDAGDWGDEW